MKRDQIINRITEAVDGELSGDDLRELIEALENHPDLENEFHAQMSQPDLARAYSVFVPKPGFEQRLATRMVSEGLTPAGNETLPAEMDSAGMDGAGMEGHGKNQPESAIKKWFGIRTRGNGSEYTGTGFEQEIIRFFRRYVLAGGLAAVMLILLILPRYQTQDQDTVDASVIESWLYGEPAELMISDAELPEWIGYPENEEELP
jgi:hypothetical protein